MRWETAWKLLLAEREAENDILPFVASLTGIPYEAVGTGTLFANPLCVPLK